MIRRHLFFSLALLIAAPTSAQQVITTIAGGGPADNIPAVGAALGLALATAVDGAGNLYVASDTFDRVFRIDAATGLMTTVAGSGLPGFSGDGGPATAAQLENPSGLAFDSSGNLYISEGWRIRRVNLAGVISTFAGNGLLSGGDGGPATSAGIGPSGIAFDATGNLFIADRYNNRVRRVDLSGIITTVAGNGTSGAGGDGGPAASASVGTPTGVAVDSAGNLLVCQEFSRRVRRINTSGIISTVAGTGVAGFGGDGGPATLALLQSPRRIAVDSTGNIFIADADNYRVRRVNPSGIISTFAGNGTLTVSGDGGPATAAGVPQPWDIAISSAGVYVMSYSHVRLVDSAGIISTRAGSASLSWNGEGGPATAASLSRPRRVVVDGAGNVVIVDSDGQGVRRIHADGTITTLAGSAPNGNFSPIVDGSLATNAWIGQLSDAAFDAAGNLYIASWGRQSIYRVDAAGTITKIAGTGTGSSGFSGDGGPATGARLSFPSGIVVDAAGNLLIADTQNNRIRRVDPAGIITTIAGTGAQAYAGDGGSATAAALFFPSGVAIDGAGRLLISDTMNRRVRRIDTSGIITTVAGNGVSGLPLNGVPATSSPIWDPSGLAIDPAGGFLIAGQQGSGVLRVDSAGILTKVAGGTFGFAGDGGPATSASLSTPSGVAIDAAGRILIADTGNHRIRRVAAPSNTPTGSNVPYSPPVTLPNGSTTSVSMTFSNVASGGNTTITTAAAGPPPPDGYKFGQPPVYYDITTTASFTGTVQLCFSWTEGQFHNEGNLRLFHHEGGSWVDITTSVDGVTNSICGVTTSLSPFALAEAAYTFAGFLPPLLADGSASVQQGKQGRTIPIKFRLERFGVPVANAIATLQVFKVVNVATGTVDTTDLTDDSGSANDSGNVFRYDLTEGQYIFNLSTKGWPAPATYRLIVTLDDGSTHAVTFSLR